HRGGPDDAQVDVMFERVLTAIDRTPFPKGTLVLVTADHGMAAISPERTAYVNVVWPELAGLLEHGADGKPLAPAGSARDLFLHARVELVDDVVDGLRTRLDGVADVEPVARLVADGAFGEVTDALRARLANVVVLPHEGEAAWWLEPGRFEQRYFGQH